MPNEDRVQDMVEVWREGGISLSYGRWWVNNRTGYVLRYHEHASFLEAGEVQALVAAVTGLAHNFEPEEDDEPGTGFPEMIDYLADAMRDEPELFDDSAALPGEEG